MLEISNLGVRYGRHQALDGVSAKIAKGEICVILGANGAGKSSLLKAIAGMVKVEPGSDIVMNGRTITGMKAHKIVEQGIALVPEGRGIFGELTVAENLQLGAFANRARSDEAENLKRLYSLFPRLAERGSQLVRTMSGGEQQMVAIGRALMSKPKILMLDEPSLGLSPMLTKELFRSLHTIAEAGVGILLVEQNARQSLKIAERGYLIENGRITGEGSAQNLMNDPAVISAYLGGAAARVVRKPVRLPPPFLLPGNLRAIGLLISGLAARAGAIQAAFVKALRQETTPPSAFAGRYDPARDGDPWEDLVKTQPALPLSPPRVSQEGRRLADLVPQLAQAAAERHACHIRAQRRSSAQPSAFARMTYDQSDSLSAGYAGRDAAALASAAAGRMAEHLRQQRLLGPVPSAFARSAEDEMPRHGALGHNSTGIDIDSEQQTGAAESVQPTQIVDIPALVARATLVLSEHVVSRRTPLTVFTLRPEFPVRENPPKTDKARD